MLDKEICEQCKHYKQMLSPILWTCMLYPDYIVKCSVKGKLLKASTEIPKDCPFILEHLMKDQNNVK